MKSILDKEVDVLVYQAAKTGNLDSGDTYYIKKNDDYLLFAIADGLGNGPVAKESADVMPEILANYQDESLDDLLLRCNEKMVRKRGAAVAIVKVDLIQKTISYSCVGNIKFYMYRYQTDSIIYTYPINGYLSGRKQKFRTQTYPFSKKDMFLLHSDGVDIKNPKDTLKQACNSKCLYESILRVIQHGDDATFIAGSLL